MFSIALYCAYSNLRCETVSHKSVIYTEGKKKIHLFVSLGLQDPQSLFPSLSLKNVFFCLSIFLLSTIYFSLAKDLYLRKTCLPLSCACQ